MKRKVFISETNWDKFVMTMRSANIGWENQAFFQFDMRTLIVCLIGAIFGGGLTLAIIELIKHIH